MSEKWEPGRWYRVLQPNGNLWMETSDRDEAVTASKQTGWPLERLYVHTRTQWRRIDPEDQRTMNDDALTVLLTVDELKFVVEQLEYLLNRYVAAEQAHAGEGVRIESSDHERIRLSVIMETLAGVLTNTE